MKSVHKNGGAVFAGVVRIFWCRRKQQNKNPVPGIMVKARAAENSTEQSKKRDCAQRGWLRYAAITDTSPSENLTKTTK